jgi:hypothetical protein
VGERFDNNILLKNTGEQPRVRSFVTSVAPVIGVELESNLQIPYSLEILYAPDFTFFHEDNEESYLRHTGILDFDLSRDRFTTSAEVSASYTDGSTLSPTWPSLVAVPALGGTEVRNRRRNLVFRANADAQYDFDPVFVRGVFDARVWDFMTEKLDLPGYQNYYDRNDLNGGLDLGIGLGSKMEGYVGGRAGYQDQQQRAFGVPFTYQNRYVRALIGLKGAVTDWFNLDGEVGPSVHSFDPSTIPAGVSSEQTYLYFRATSTFVLGKNTTFKASGGQHILPGSGGPSPFQNLTASGLLMHKFTPNWRGAVTFKYTDYFFQPPARRHDRVYAPGARLEYQVNTHLSLAAWYTYQLAESVIPDRDFRGYNRQIGGLSITAEY